MKRTGIGILIGFLAAILLSFLIYKILQKTSGTATNDYYVITNQIKRMNKMVVMEQESSSMHKTKVTSDLLGGLVPVSTTKTLIMYTKTNAQVSYDLNKMEMEVDSINKKLIIKQLPEPEIKIIPSVEIQSMDDSIIDRFDESDIKRIQKNAKDKAYKEVNQQMLIAEGRKQLKENLNQIFVLAKALNYKIEDKTGLIDVTQL